MRYKSHEEVPLKGEVFNFIILFLLTAGQLITNFYFPSDLYFVNFITVLISGGLILLDRLLNWDLRFTLLFFLFSATLGTSGSAVIFLSLMLYYVYKRLTQTLGDLLASLNPDLAKDQSEIVYERIMYHLDNFNPHRIPIPFTDLMAFGNYTQKRMAIEKMLRYYRPEFANPLKMGLDDPSSSVKVQAATAINFIDHKKFDENIELKKLSEKFPRDLNLLRIYADNTFDYLKAGILDEDRKKKLIQRGIESYLTYLKRDPHDEEAILRLAELLFLAKEYTETKKWLEVVLKRKFSRQAALLMMKTLYLTKKYEELREFAFSCKEHEKEELPDELDEKIKFWTSHEPS